MRLTAVILLASLMQVSASSFAQRISLSEKGSSLSRVFEKIKSQAGIDFVVSTEILKSSRPVDINVRNMQLNDVLKTIFKDQPLDYSIEDKFVVVSRKEPSVLDKAKSAIMKFVLDLTVRGRVLDEKGMPMPGATVTVKGTTRRTMTNDRGEFTLTGVDEKAILVINYLGFQPKEIPASATFLEVRLSEKAGELAEVDVVSTGYQVLPKERSAGSFAKVDMDVIANRTTSMNVLQSLDGLVPGLVVNNVPNRSQVLIRGLSTTGGTTGVGTTSQPLYVVDGLAMPKIDANDNQPDMILGINPQDIESITVLKDATAASIWGARASNGVIVIKTKSGKFNSKLRVNYSGFVNFQGKPDLDYNKLLSPRQFVEAGTEIFNTPGYLSQYPYATVSALNGGGITPLELILYNPQGRTAAQVASSVDSLASLDNRSQIKDLFYRNALLTNHTASLSGGGDKYSFYTSASYTNVVSSKPGEKNQNFKINLRQDLKVSDNLSFYLVTDLSNNTSSLKRNLDVDYFFHPYQMFRDASGSNLSIPFMTNISNEVLANAQARSRISLDYNPLN